MTGTTDSAAAVEHETRTVPRQDRKPKILPPYHVVLLDDDDHTYDYVIEMLMKLFGHSIERAFQMACEVDGTGRVIVDTTNKERAEFKQQQIHAFGPDWREKVFFYLCMEHQRFWRPVFGYEYSSNAAFEVAMKRAYTAKIDRARGARQ